MQDQEYRGDLVHLTDDERKSYVCSNLLAPPGGEVVRGLLTTLNEVRGELKQLQDAVSQG